MVIRPLLSSLTRSSLSILLLTRASSPSTVRAGFGMAASSTKWLSQCGQYSSASSNSCASLRKHFLHFLHANVISKVRSSSCVSFSAWHSAQSNHFLPVCFFAPVHVSPCVYVCVCVCIHGRRSLLLGNSGLYYITASGQTYSMVTGSKLERSGCACLERAIH